MYDNCNDFIKSIGTKGLVEIFPVAHVFRVLKTKKLPIQLMHERVIVRIGLRGFNSLDRLSREIFITKKFPLRYSN